MSEDDRVVASVEQILSEIKEITARVKTLRAERDDALRRTQAAEARAVQFEQRYEAAKRGALRASALEIACEHLVEALERLPLRMEDAGMKQMVVPPEIPLYGTHEWDAVVQAKRRLSHLLPEYKEEDDGEHQENPAGAS